MTRPTAYHDDIRRIEQQLQEIGGHQRQAEQQDFPQQRAVGHVHRPGGLHG